MLRALSMGRNGLHANQYKLDSISDEIANVNTNGYKKSEVSFQELLLDQDTSVGVKAHTNKTNFKQGNLVETSSKWDLAIEGDGFFLVKTSDGSTLLKRDGSFQVSENGTISDKFGNILKINYNDGFQDVQNIETSINKEGSVSAIINGEPINIGKIPLYMPSNLQDLKRVGENSYIVNGNMLNSIDDPEVFGDITSGFLESSNSDLTRALTDMMVTQRAYSLNSQAIKSVDEIMRMINDIKR